MWIEARPAREDERHSGGLVGLLALVAFVGGLGYLLWRVDGPPQAPAGLLDLDRVRELLTASRIADGDAITIAATVGWLALGYLTLTVTLRVLLVIAERLLGAPRWLRGMVRASDLITLPAVRQIVDGAVAGTLLLAASLPSAAAARAAAPSPPAVVSTVRTSPWHATLFDGHEGGIHEPVQQEVRQEHIGYTVVRGDYLWAIARRFYGDGTRWPEIFEVNEGRLMPGGQRFVDPDLIYPGWVLSVPLPAQHLHAGPDGALAYEVQPGDSLWRIAERLLGDGFRWDEIWELNARAEMLSGSRFTDPNMIQPGWRLTLPLSALPGDVAEPAPAPARPEPTLAPVEPTPSNGASPVPAVVTPPAAVDGAEHEPGGWSLPRMPRPAVPRELLFTAAGFAVLGGAVVIVQRLWRAGALRWPAGRLGPRGGLGDAGRVTIAARALALALDDLGFGDARSLLIVESPDELEFTVACPPGDADALADARYDLGRRLACTIDADVVGSTRVVLSLRGFQRLAGLLSEARLERPPLPVPVGANDVGIVYLDLGTAGSIAVAGEPPERRRMLRAWLATLHTTVRPDEAVVRCDAETTAFLGSESLEPVDQLPADPGAFADELDELVLARDADAGGSRVLLAIIDAAPSDVERLESAIPQGPRVGAFVVCGMGADDPAAHTFAVAVRLGQGAGDEEADGERPPDAVELALPGGEVLILDPVRVRVDESTHWRGEEPVPPTDESSNKEGVAAVAEAATSPDDADTESNSESQVDDGAVTVTDEEEDDGEDISAHGAEDAAAVPFVDEEPESSVATSASAAVAAPPLPAETQPAITPSSGAVRQGMLFVDDEAGAAGEAAVAPFTVRCFGPFEVEFEGTRIEQWRMHKSRELLAFLAARGGNSVSRDAVIEALFPEELADRAGAILNDTAYHLRRTLRSASRDTKARLVVAASLQYRLEPGRFAADLDSFDAHLHRARALEGAEALAEFVAALDLYRDEFLEGEPYEWAEPLRVDYVARALAAARDAGEMALEMGNAELARRLFQRALERGPTDEVVARGLLRAHAAAHDIAGARKAYRTFVETLRSELQDESVRPAPETTALLEEIISGDPEA